MTIDKKKDSYCLGTKWYKCKPILQIMLESYLWFESGMRADLQMESSEEDTMDDTYASLCSPQYKSFSVFLVQKVGRNVEALLGKFF